MADRDDTSENSIAENIPGMVRRYGSWLVGGFLILLGIGSLFAAGDGVIRAVLAGLLFFAAGAVALPPTRPLLADQAGVEFAGWMVAIIVLVGFFAGGAMLPASPDTSEDVGGEATPTLADTDEADEEAGQEPAETQTGDASTASPEEAGDTPPSTPETTPSPEQAKGIQVLMTDTYPDYGMMTGISPSGRYAAFGLHTGDFEAYDASNDASQSSATSVDRRPSHIQMQDDATASVAFMDAEVMGGIDFTTGGGLDWTVQYPHLWDIDPNADHSAVAATTYPDEGPGRVGVATNDGETKWDVSLWDAAGEGVALADSGDFVAVAAIEHWTGGTDQAGEPGIRAHDGSDGAELWSRDGH